MVAPLFWEQEEQFDSDILHHPLWFVRHCLKVRETVRTLTESKSMF